MWPFEIEIVDSKKLLLCIVYETNDILITDRLIPYYNPYSMSTYGYIIYKSRTRIYMYIYVCFDELKVNDPVRCDRFTDLLVM